MDLLLDIFLQVWPYLLVLLVGSLIGGWILKWYDNRKRLLRLNRGKNLEQKAFKILEEMGYSIVDYQPKLESKLIIDGNMKTFRLSPDFKVEKNGLRYYVEVKSGNTAPDVSYAPTRRQLLEYAMASDAKSILLLDVEGAAKISKIEFPNSIHAVKASRGRWKWLSILLSFGYVALLVYFAFQALLKLF